MDGHGGGDDARARWPEFVAARWSSVEAVALVATLDPPAARRLTVEAFRDVHRGWARIHDDGSPTAAVRSALLGRVATLPAVREHALDPSLVDPVTDDDTAVPGGLLDALTHETPLARAATGAGLFWDVGADDVVALLPRRAATALAGSGPVRERLLAAHRAALAADGLGPQDHRLDDDLADLLRRVADTAAEPSDPAGTVEDAVGSGPGRRLAVTGVAAAAALGVTGWLVLGRGGGDTFAGPAPRATRSVPPPDSPLWRSSAQWPSRGSLLADPGVERLVASTPGSRLLWADDLHGVRLVVATDPSTEIGPDVTPVRWWRGPAGASAEQLVELTTNGLLLVTAPHHVALGCRLPSGGGLVVVLGRPQAPDAEVSLVVAPDPDGTIRRRWTPVPVRDGVGSTVLPRTPGLASRLRFDEYDGGLPTTLEDPDAATALGEFDLASEVVAATGVPKDRLEVSAEARALPVDVRISGTDRLVAVVTRVRLPSGALVRSVRIGDREDTLSMPLNGAEVVPATEPGAPVVVPFFDDDLGRERHLVLLPRVARTVRAEAAVYSSARPRTVRVEDGVAVLDLGGSPEIGTRDLRLRVEDGSGRVLHDGPAPSGRPLLDVWPEDVAN